MLPTAVAREARDNVLDYLRTTFAINDERLETALVEFLGGPDGLLRGPFLDVRLPFKVVKGGELSELLDVAPAYPPYQHQVRAFERLSSKDGRRPAHTLITTGTGSGKTECFLYPVLDHCAREKAAGRKGVKAILLYPMNALATDQARRIAKELDSDPRLAGVSAGLYVGGEGSHKRPTRENLVDDRAMLRKDPPDILLTNYRMLDFLLLRPEDGVLWQGNGPDTLRYIVLDELHTYDGAQGSDVACLLRRLKARLGTPDGGLCCVGTSATIGSTDGSRHHLVEFAASIFGEPVGPQALIGEERQSIEEVFPNLPSVNRAPARNDLGRLAPEGRTPGEWLRAQSELWLGDGDLVEDPLALGEALAVHRYLHDVLGFVCAGPMASSDIVEHLAAKRGWFLDFSDDERMLALDSFVGLISHARRRTDVGDTTRAVPFLTVQVQLWIRELRGLVRAVGDRPEFRWRSAMGGSAVEALAGPSADDGPAHLPMVRCRECGTIGLASAQRDGEPRLLDDRRENSIGLRWLQRDSSCRFVVPGHDEGEADGLFAPPKDYLCPFCLTRTTEAGCGCRGDTPTPPFAVRILQDTAQDKANGPYRFKPVCPDCGTEDSLMFLAARSPSLLSVAVSHLFQSDYNGDKKLLAFVDGVQDASHRAGFFGSRTYRFNLRTLIQGVVDSRPEPIRLTELTDALIDATAEKVGVRARAIPILVPEDLRQHPEYEAFLAADGKGQHPGLERWLGTRVALETVFEYGFAVRAGRSLESTGASTAFVDPERLRSAVDEVALVLGEENPLGLIATTPSRDSVHVFVHAIVQRLRLRGGVFHSLLDGYVTSGGARFMLQRFKSPTGPLFARDAVLPRFLQAQAPSGQKRSAFDAFVPRKEGQNWFADLAARVFGIHRDNAGITGLVEQTLRSLVHADVLARRTTDTGNRDVYGIDPAALLVTGQVARLTCGQCRGRLTVPVAGAAAHAGTPCHRYRCPGTYGAPETPAPSFYTRIFRGGRIAPVFPEEHTGLLDRKTRERIEERFIDGSAPDGPNMLVATPTLEMGIDIGTLSAVLLCSVPPTPSMYLQRVGRAGRSTGNALTITVALARPHDLYFHEEPTEMLAGHVDPPGVFLDAPEMLKRQLVAFVMDDWAKGAGKELAIPRQVNTILSGQSTLVDSIIAHYAAHAERLRDAFIGGFGTKTLSENSIEEIRRFAGGDNIANALREAFETVRADRTRLRNLRDRARTRYKEIEESMDSASETARLELEEAKRAHMMLSKLYRVAGEQYPLQVLTDAGVLPNYAFPEPGVELESVISSKQGGKTRYEAHTYRRPASVALRELAPSNTFYAEGRRVRIDEIDLGSTANPLLETWRFCPSCPHVDKRVEPGAIPEAQCPRCGDTDWADTDSVRKVVHFQRSKSHQDRLEAAIADDGDERVQERYHTLDLIDAGTAKGAGARVIPSVPFGFELLKDLELIEVNFGPQDNEDGAVAGASVNKRGFEVCEDCGRVRVDGRASKIRHSATCRTKSNKQERIVGVHLYRRVRSEALRLLLPIASTELDAARASFLAALELGLRLHFGGRAPHLRTKVTHEPVGDGRRNYIVLFDTVPGGTGTLLDLYREDRVMDMLRASLRKMEQCSCDDGCYRCLYAFQVQRNLEMTSKRVAVSLLREILPKSGELEDADSLSSVAIDDRLESELEERFVRALLARARRKGIARQTLENGERVWEIQVGEARWKIRPQVPLGKSDGVSMATRPDFLITPQSTRMRALPIAVYCDGFRYHVQPDEPEGRIHDDVAKRTAVARSGRYRTWSVTWDDVDEFESGKRELRDTLLAASPTKNALEACRTRWGIEVDRAVSSLQSMELLWQHLLRGDDEWFAGQVTFLGAAKTIRPTTLPEDWAEECRTRLVTLEERPSEVPPDLDVLPESTWLSGLAQTPSTATFVTVSMNELKAKDAPRFQWTLRLYDSHGDRRGVNFRVEWRRFLQALNLVQFAESYEAVTTEGLDLVEAEALALPAVAEPSPEPVPDAPPADRGASENAALWEELGLLPEEIQFADAVFAAVGLAPEPGLPLVRNGREAANAPLAWPTLRLALVDDAGDRAAFEDAGWRVESFSAEPAAVAAIAKEQSS